VQGPGEGRRKEEGTKEGREGEKERKGRRKEQKEGGKMEGRKEGKRTNGYMQNMIHALQKRAWWNGSSVDPDFKPQYHKINK
jgi:hypothetical protein